MRLPFSPPLAAARADDSARRFRPLLPPLPFLARVFPFPRSGWHLLAFQFVLLVIVEPALRWRALGRPSSSRELRSAHVSNALWSCRSCSNPSNTTLATRIGRPPALRSAHWRHSSSPAPAAARTKFVSRLHSPRPPRARLCAGGISSLHSPDQPERDADRPAGFVG